ncbi:6-phospho-3-hexuloisomerase, partial [Staphylococcus epidermidis]
MMATFNHYQLILDELKGALSRVKDEEFDGFASEVTEASRIFVAGKG